MNLVGVDISPEQVSLAKQVVEKVYEKNLFDFLRTVNQNFDLIIGLDIIEHLYKEEVIEFLDLCYSRLNNGGRLILSTPNADSPFFGSVRYGDFTHENTFTPNALEWVVGISGFKHGTARELNPVPLSYGFQSTIRFLLWKIIWVGIYGWNIIETGGPKSKVYTRNFIFSALKQ
jgi:SAM-dependent methyltransferase